MSLKIIWSPVSVPGRGVQALLSQGHPLTGHHAMPHWLPCSPEVQPLGTTTPPAL